MTRFLVGFFLSLIAVNSAHGKLVPLQLQASDVLVIHRNGSQVTFERCDAKRVDCHLLSGMSVGQLQVLKTEIEQMPVERFPQTWANLEESFWGQNLELSGVLTKTFALAYPTLLATFSLLEQRLTWDVLKRGNPLAVGALALVLAGLYVGGDQLHEAGRTQAVKARKTSKEDVISIIDKIIEFELSAEPGHPQVLPLPKWLWVKIDG